MGGRRTGAQSALKRLLPDVRYFQTNDVHSVPRLKFSQTIDHTLLYGLWIDLSDKLADTIAIKV